MPYELYTVPKCDQCDSVKKLLDEKKIACSVYNLRDPNHKKYYSKVYLQVDGKLERNVSDKYALLPILFEVDESRNVKHFAQRLEGITKMIS